MPVAFLLWVAVYLICVVPDGSYAIEKTLSPEQLVRQLGHPDFSMRSQAEQQLLNLGYESYLAITAGAESNDPEIRFRAARLLKLLQKEAFANRRVQLRTNPWTVPPQLAPGWEEFHALLGDGPEARNLYVQVLNTETELMLVLGQPGWQFEFERRCGELQAFSQQRQPVELQPAAIAALLFLACHPENQPSGSASSVIYMLMSDSQFRHAAQYSQESGVLKDLVSCWIRKSENSSPMQRLSDAASFEVDAALDVARQTIRDRNTQQMSSIHLENSIFYLALHGGLDAVDELEELLNDDQRLRNGSRDAELDVQVRDAALAALLYVTSQEDRAKEYGFNSLRTKSGYLYIGSSVRFDSLAARQKAFDKWYEWRAANLGEAVRLPLDASYGELL